MHFSLFKKWICISTYIHTCMIMIILYLWFRISWGPASNCELHSWEKLTEYNHESKSTKQAYTCECVEPCILEPRKPQQWQYSGWSGSDLWIPSDPFGWSSDSHWGICLCEGNPIWLPWTTQCWGKDQPIA